MKEVSLVREDDKYGLRAQTYDLREQAYDQAEARIVELLEDENGHRYMADELVEQLGEEGVPSDTGSTVMWEMIGAGALELSDEWRVSLSHRNPAAAD